jgi:hypothetical protein
MFNEERLGFLKYLGFLAFLGPVLCVLGFLGILKV